MIEAIRCDAMRCDAVRSDVGVSALRGWAKSRPLYYYYYYYRPLLL
jgi:hypothetical protein